jgi:hypothetical protein
MTCLNDQPREDLQSRLENLEAQLSRLQARESESRPRRLSFGLVQVLIPGLAFAGWALAQQELQPAPAPGSPDSKLIWKEGDTTYLAAPFQVVSADGAVLLHVSKDGDSNAAVSIENGMLEVNAPGGKPVAGIGVHAGGLGGVAFVTDTKGEPRALMIGNGAVVVRNAAGKQLAGVIAATEGTGRVAVWGASGKGQKVASLDEGPDGSGKVIIYDKQANEIAVLNAGQNGRGVVQVSDKGRTFASLSMNDAGAGQLLLTQPDGSFGLEAVGTSQRSGYAAGGVIAAFGAGGNVVAGFGTGANGKGVLTVQDEGRIAASLGVSDNATGVLSLFNKQGQDSFLASGGGAEGQGDLILSNGSGTPTVFLGMSDSGEGTLNLMHNGSTAAELKSDATGIGSLDLRDASGEIRLSATAGSAEIPGGAVYAFNKNGKPVVSLGSSADGKGEVTVSEEIREVAKLTANIVGAGTLYLMNKNGDIGLESTGQGTEGPAGGSVTSFARDSVAASFGTDDDGNGNIRVVAKDKTAAEIAVYNSSGGGIFKAYNSQGKLAAGLGSDNDKGRVAVYGQNGGGLAQLAEGESGAGLVQVKNTKDQVVAGMTGGASDTGALMVLDSAGKTLAEISSDRGMGRVVIWDTGANLSAAMMTRTGTGGAIQVFNSKTNVGNLFVGPGGGGQLQLHDPSGVNMVEAGSLTNGVGVVRAGPNVQCAGTKMGLANPDCIVGRKN